MAPISAAGEKVTIYTAIWHPFSALEVAQLKGFYQKEGVEVEILTFNSGAEAMEGFRAGKADFLGAGTIPALILAAGGGAKILCPINYSTTSLIVLAPPEVKKPSDLKGKRVGVKVNASSEYLLVKYLEGGGLTRDDVKVIDLSPVDLVAALDKGDVDAIATWEPFGLNKSKFFTRDVGVVARTEDAGFVEYAVFVAAEEFAHKNPGLTKSVLSAVKRSVDWLRNATMDEKVDLLAKRMGLSDEDYKKLAGVHNYMMAETPGYRVTLQNMADFLFTRRLIPRPIKVKNILGSEFLMSVDASLVF
jgi:NitT/TauT family transport system substrate-binding protein